MKKLRLLFDMDAILVDLLRPWIAWYNESHQDELHIDNVVGYHLEKYATKCTVDQLFGFFTHERYEACPVMPGASEGMKELFEAGHHVAISTATAGETAQSKWRLAKKVAPWMSEGNIMVGSLKEWIKADVFVDDAPKNVVKYRNEWKDQAHILTIAYPYNRDIKSLVNLYAEDHNNTVQAWDQIVEYIRKVAHA